MRDAEKPQLNVCRRRCCLATSFISKAKSQPSKSTPFVLGASLPVPMARFELRRDLRHVAHAHWRVHRADVNHAARPSRHAATNNRSTAWPDKVPK